MNSNRNLRHIIPSAIATRKGAVGVRRKRSSSSSLIANTFATIILFYVLMLIITIYTIPDERQREDHFDNKTQLFKASSIKSKTTGARQPHALQDGSMDTNKNKHIVEVGNISNGGDDWKQDDDESSSAQQIDDRDEQNSELGHNNNESSSAYLTMYNDQRASQSLANLPGWLQDYVQWNRNQMRISDLNSNTTKYLVLMCLPDDNSCGGLSDRFRGILWYLFLAKVSNRVLCIYWTRPFPLQTFLSPTQTGINWICPEDELGTLVNQLVPTGRQSKLRVYYFMDCEATRRHPAQPEVPCVRRELANLLNSTDRFAVTRLFGNTVTAINKLNMFAQRYSYNEYMPIINQWQHPDMMQDVFRAFFKPVDALAQRVNTTMAQLGLVENEYVSVHVRARYPVRKYATKKKITNAIDKEGALEFEGHIKDYLVDIIDNAIQCGHFLAPDLPIYFASDHNNVTNYVLSNTFTGKEDGKELHPVGLNSDKMPVHVGIREFQGINHSDFFSVFEDLLILGGSRCVSHGIGSFGSFGAGLSGNKCRAVHRKFDGRSASCPNDRGESKKVKIHIVQY